jgi:Rrf2 family protein
LGRGTRFTVAVHALALLDRAGGESLTSDQIARSVNTDPVVVRRVLGLLANAGLVTTHLGPHGGARLARPAGQIDLGTVFAAVERDPLIGLHAASPDPDCPVGANIEGTLRPILSVAEEALRASLARTTVASVARRLRTRRR